MAEFVTGEFRKLRVANKVHLGQIQQDLPEGEVVEFDGTTLRWAGLPEKCIGGETKIPGLCAAYRAGWLVDVADTVTKYVAKPAGVKVHSAQTTGNKKGDEIEIGTASEEETVVGEVGNVKKRVTAAAEEARLKGKAQVHAKADPAPAPKPAPVPAPKKVSKFPLQVEGEDEERVVKTLDGEAAPGIVKASSEGIAIAQIRTPAKQAKVVLDDAHKASQAILNAENAPPPKLLKKSAAIAEGEDIRKTLPGGATGDVAAAKSGDDLADLLPDAASAGAPAPGVVASTKDAATTGTGFSWDKKIHWRQRVKKAAEFRQDKDTLKAIFKVEAPFVVKHIKAELAAIEKAEAKAKKAKK